MRKYVRPMADSVMGFLYPLRIFLPILTVMSLLSGCGNGSYEAIAYQSDSQAVNEDSANRQDADSLTESVESQDETEPSLQSIYVYVCGAVNAPGVYMLPEGERIYRAIEAAGGFTEQADREALNQAAPLSDGDQIIVYTKDQTASMETTVVPDGMIHSNEESGGAQGDSEETQKININTADAQELQKINGIGASRAADIIQYRETQGSFESIEDIMNVSGIKQAMFDKIKEQITVR